MGDGCAAVSLPGGEWGGWPRVTVAVAWAGGLGYDVPAFTWWEVCEMNADAIREFLSRRPFEPFVIRMSNGEVHEVLHPECAIVMKSKVIVGYPEQDRAVYCALIHINSVEAMQDA